jgi:ABC-2 type transport system permease protein
MLIIAVVGLSMSFLIGSLVKNRSAQSAVANTVGLGLAFLSGCSSPVPVERLRFVRARFFPVYWYVKANDEIGGLQAFGWEHLQPVVYSFLIQLGYAAALVCVTLVLTRQKGTGAQRLKAR